MIEKAIIFATVAHEGQKRKATDTPYILHPLEAANIVASIKYDPDLICAAILHDTAEDVNVSISSIKTMFGEKVADLVLFQSEDKSKSWKERKQHTINVLTESTDEDAIIVCLADKLSNMRSMYRDYKAQGDAIWERFNAPKSAQAWYYKGLKSAMILLENYAAYKEYCLLVDEVYSG